MLKLLIIDWYFTGNTDFFLIYEAVLQNIIAPVQQTLNSEAQLICLSISKTWEMV